MRKIIWEKEIKVLINTPYSCPAVTILMIPQHSYFSYYTILFRTKRTLRCFWEREFSCVYPAAFIGKGWQLATLGKTGAAAASGEQSVGPRSTVQRPRRAPRTMRLACRALSCCAALWCYGMPRDMRTFRDRRDRLAAATSGRRAQLRWALISHLGRRTPWSQVDKEPLWYLR